MTWLILRDSYTKWCHPPASLRTRASASMRYRASSSDLEDEGVGCRPCMRLGLGKGNAQTGDMAHLAAGTRGELAIDMEIGIRDGKGGGKSFHMGRPTARAEQIDHDGSRGDHLGAAEG